MPLNSKRRAQPVGLQQWRIAMCLWSIVAVVAWLAPWPYAIAATLFVTFLHLAMLDNRAG